MNLIRVFLISSLLQAGFFDNMQTQIQPSGFGSNSASVYYSGDYLDPNTDPSSLANCSDRPDGNIATWGRENAIRFHHCLGATALIFARQIYGIYTQDRRSSNADCAQLDYGNITREMLAANPHCFTQWDYTSTGNVDLLNQQRSGSEFVQSQPVNDTNESYNAVVRETVNVCNEWTGCQEQVNVYYPGAYLDPNTSREDLANCDEKPEGNIATWGRDNAIRFYHCLGNEAGVFARSIYGIYTHDPRDNVECQSVNYSAITREQLESTPQCFTQWDYTNSGHIDLWQNRVAGNSPDYVEPIEDDDGSKSVQLEGEIVVVGDDDKNSGAVVIIPTPSSGEVNTPPVSVVAIDGDILEVAAPSEEQEGAAINPNVFADDPSSPPASVEPVEEVEPPRRDLASEEDEEVKMPNLRPSPEDV